MWFDRLTMMCTQLIGVGVDRDDRFDTDPVANNRDSLHQQPEHLLAFDESQDV